MLCLPFGRSALSLSRVGSGVADDVISAVYVNTYKEVIVQ